MKSDLGYEIEITTEIEPHDNADLPKSITHPQVLSDLEIFNFGFLCSSSHGEEGGYRVSVKVYHDVQISIYEPAAKPLNGMWTKTGR